MMIDYNLGAMTTWVLLITSYRSQARQAFYMVLVCPQYSRQACEMFGRSTPMWTDKDALHNALTSVFADMTGYHQSCRLKMSEIDCI
jgi:hypothetical protein